MRKIIFLKTVILLLSINIVSIAQGVGSDIEGYWFCKDLEHSTMKIYKKNGYWYGKIIESKSIDFQDEMILYSLVYNEKKWEGDVKNPSVKIRGKAELTLINKNKLKVVGKKFLLSKNLYWTRIKDYIPK